MDGIDGKQCSGERFALNEQIVKTSGRTDKVICIDLPAPKKSYNVSTQILDASPIFSIYL